MERLYYRAEFLRTNKEYKKALPAYLYLLDHGLNTPNINYKTGITCLQIPGKKKQSIFYLLIASEKTTRKYNNEFSYTETKAPVETYLYLGDAYLKNNRIEKASEYYRQYKNKSHQKKNKDIAEARLQQCQYAHKLMESPLDISFIKLPVSLPDRYNFNAALSFDAKSIAFNSNRKDYIAVYYAKKVNHVWTPPRNISTEIESDGDYLVSSVSFDGKTLFLVNQEQDDDDIFVSFLQKGRWTKAIPLKGRVNTIYNETHAVSTTDGKYLYIVSDRTGGKGGFDIYRLESDGNGKWNHIKNLGSGINTKEDEASPFLNKSQDTLFFSSKGHQTMGGYDIFSIPVHNPDSLQHAVNLGYPVNTTDDDLFFLPWQGDTLGFISKTDSSVPSEKTLCLAGTFKIIPPQQFPENKSPAESKTDHSVHPIYLISPVFFKFNSYSLDQKSKARLDTLIEALTKYPLVHVQINGYTDNKGSLLYNKNLSEKRAESVLNYLISKGIKESRINFSGKGENDPIKLNTLPGGTDNPEGRKLNRRVSFSFSGEGYKNLKTKQ